MSSKLLSLMTDHSRVQVVCATNLPWLEFLKELSTFALSVILNLNLYTH